MVPEEIDEGIMDSHLIRLRFKDHAVDPSFMALLIDKGHYVREQIVSGSKGTIMNGLNSSIIKEVWVGLPDLTTQRRITKYVGEQTAKIDRLMDLRRRQMALLKEQRAALIQQAVTRGLNPDVPMKDSGLPWLGEIPKHWKVYRIAIAVIKNTNGFVGPTRDILVDDGVRYLQSLHIKAGQIRFDKPYFVSKEWSHAHSKSILQEGDVLVVQTGDVGQVAAVPKKFEGCNCHALIILRIRPSLGNGFYLAVLFNSHFGKQALMRETTGALLPHLECGKIRDIRLPFPPAEEQEQILEFIRGEDIKLETIHSSYARQLNLLAEYRAALIHESVTGQRPVPEPSSQEANAHAL